MRGAITWRVGELTFDNISTHTPHAGSDTSRPRRSASACHFNSHSPCGERYFCGLPPPCVGRFQLTLPMRGAIADKAETRAKLRISTHAPHAGSDTNETHGDIRSMISTHAPHAGSDKEMLNRWLNRRYFNSRSPCGERCVSSARRSVISRFQLTLPMRGAIEDSRITIPVNSISTHAPHAGSDGENEIVYPTCGHVPISPYLEYRAQDKLRTLCHFSNRREVEILDSCPNSTQNKVRAHPTQDENYRFAPNDKFLCIIHFLNGAT